MYRRTQLSEEAIQDILKEYQDLSVTVAQIAHKHGISTQTVSTIANKYGLPYRINRQKQSKPRTCLNCRKKVYLPNAKYCPYCGSLIQTENERIIEMMTKIRGMLQFIPESMRDDFSEYTMEVLNYLKKIDQK